MGINKIKLSSYIVVSLLYSSVNVATAKSNRTAGSPLVFVSPDTPDSSGNVSRQSLMPPFQPLHLQDCLAYLVAGFKASGAYKIYPFGQSEDGIYVYCDMDTDGGGWTVILQRGIRGTVRELFQNPQLNFTTQFGTTCGDGWIGMEALYALTSKRDQQVQFTYRKSLNYLNWKNETSWYRRDYRGNFKKFWIGNKTENYKLSLSLSWDNFYFGDANEMKNLTDLEFLTSYSWEENCSNKTFNAPGWYNTANGICTTNGTTNLFGTLEDCDQKYGALCASEIKIRSLLGVVVIDGESMNLEKAKQMLESAVSAPQDCTEHFLIGNRTSGNYRIFPDRQLSRSVEVYCDMSTESGGWTTIMKRGNHKLQQESFDVSLDEYEAGFGSACADQFIGLENIYKLTSASKNELRVELRDWTQYEWQWPAYANYKTFSIGTAEENYVLTVGDFSSGGSAGDSLSAHSNASFTALDSDNDEWDNGNCAEEYGGGWWYVDCLKSNLNGVYLNQTNFAYGQGIVWASWKGFNYSLKSAEMKIRNSNFLALKRLTELM